MGCCFSSSKKRRRSSPPSSAINCRDPPPPPPLEEETVKEVLSETPINPKPHHLPKVLVNDKIADFSQVKINESTAVVKPSDEMRFEPTAVIKSSNEMRFESAAVVNQGDSIKLVDEMNFETTAVIKPQVSEEPSEMCSFTESYSTTATATEKREEDGEVTQRSPIRVHRKRQNSGDLTRVRERSFREDRRRRRRKGCRRRRQEVYRGGECRNNGAMWAPQMGPEEVPEKMELGGRILRRRVDRLMHVGM
ncbi:hypothetical protein RND71_012321 [Anisodus tanguticus]|uniref:Uncharacterized protein n=1 Tax=Anisodus tanguticus TaxID=243964 RepID=A0AAE1VPN9_9SOLA|nr:hypothetical protein RND71_012321 [Anisodus tanguticus]